jgi:opacity protein-like surface antigen
MKRLCLSHAIITSLIIQATTPIFAQTSHLTCKNWTGPYAGLSFGAGQGNANTSFTTNSHTNTISEDIVSTTQTITNDQSSGKLDGNNNGSIANLLIGYNYNPARYPNLVFSGQLEGTFFSNITLDTSGQQNASFTQNTNDGVVSSTDTTQINSPYELSDELKSMATFLLRGGYLIQPTTLIYALIGGVEGNFVTPFNDDFIDQQRNKWVLGYTIGAGLEVKLNDNWSIRGEYRFIQFNFSRNSSTTGTFSQNPEGPNNSSISQFNASGHVNTHFNFNMGTVSIVYQF